MFNEATYVSLLCSLLGGAEPELRHYFDVHGYDRPRNIRVDCETPTHVIEMGLDERSSSRDSVHQAVLAAHFTGKAPLVILIDRDGDEGRYELEMRFVTDLLDVAYVRCSAGFLESWSASAGLRTAPAFEADDLPSNPTASARCPLTTVFADSVQILPSN